jgi:hypothetical protein
MVRAKLTKLLGNSELLAVPEVAASSRSASASVGSGDAPEKPDAAAVVPASEPLYLRYQRKETRLRDDQQNGLTLLARRLTRAKGSGGERITDNTLIRVAVDLLLARSTDLAGADEDALRASVGLQ